MKKAAYLNAIELKIGSASGGLDECVMSVTEFVLCMLLWLRVLFVVA